jgi:hypothetical protein
MTKSWLTGVFVLMLLASCEKKEPFVYQYEANPLYTWGYADFWGDYYQAYAIPQNVVSLSLFTNNLSVDSTGGLIGTGQYLFLEDIFIAPSDTILPPGIYTVSESTDSFNIAPGEQLEIDGQKFEVGAFVYFLEKNEHFSTIKFITSGTMQVIYTETSARFEFSFILDDKTSINGSYVGQLPYFDARYADDEQSLPSKSIGFAFPSGNRRRVQ